MSYSNIYFIGIGGIGMSAIARYYKFKGCNVSGYDRTRTELTDRLEAEGISVHFEDRPELIPADKDNTLVVYTPAIPEDFGELRFAIDRGYRVIKRSRILGEITAGQVCLAVAGTHGKTTTSTLVAHILTESGVGCSAFLGGISKNYGTNMLCDHSRTVVVEADEFDRSFHQLHPAISAITAMDADHLDIYGDHAHVIEAFKIYASQVSETLILKLGLPIRKDEVSLKALLSSQQNIFEGLNIRYFGPFDGHNVAEIVRVLSDIKVGALGMVNVENSIAAAGICLCHGVDAQKIKHAIGSFEGARRRLDLHFNAGGMTYIDDYAHHPEELHSAISSVREIYPGRKLTGIFQPHLFTRTRDFAPEFAKSLSLLDKLILLDIYPAREEPIKGVSSEIIFKDVTCPEMVLLDKEALMDYMQEEKVDVLMTLGAGNIDQFIEPLTLMLQNRLK